MARDLQEAEIETTRASHQFGRMIATLIGVAALVVAAFTDWIPGRAADDLTLKSLVRADMQAQSDFLKTAGALTVLIALVALLGLVDRTGWLTRLAGAAALIVFVMFAVQSYRYYGNDLSAAFHHSRTGIWLLLGGGLVLLIGGFFGARITAVQAVVESDREEHLRDENYPDERYPGGGLR